MSSRLGWRELRQETAPYQPTNSVWKPILLDVISQMVATQPVSEPLTVKDDKADDGNRHTTERVEQSRYRGWKISIQEMNAIS